MTEKRKKGETIREREWEKRGGEGVVSGWWKAAEGKRRR